MKGLSTYAKFSEKLTFLSPWYAHVRVHIRGLEMLAFWKILGTYLMDNPPPPSLLFLFNTIEYRDETWWNISITYEQHL